MLSYVLSWKFLGNHKKNKKVLAFYIALRYNIKALNDGEVAKWLNAADCNSAHYVFDGSNPSLPTICLYIKIKKTLTRKNENDIIYKRSKESEEEKGSLKTGYDKEKKQQKSKKRKGKKTIQKK